MSIILRVGKSRLIVAVLFALWVPLGLASSVPVVSGSYELVHETGLGSQAQIRMRIHLVNHGVSSLAIQRMTLRDFSHSDKGGTQACAVMLRAHSFADTTQEFIIRRPDYQLWQKGLRPRLVLEMAGLGNTKTKAVVRLDRTLSKEAK